MVVLLARLDNGMYDFNSLFRAMALKVEVSHHLSKVRTYVIHPNGEVMVYWTHSLL